MSVEQPLDVGEIVVYPPHGLGRIIGFEQRNIAGSIVNLIVLRFEPAGMTIHLPQANRAPLGLRRLVSKAAMSSALDIIRHGGTVPDAPLDWKRSAKQVLAEINTCQPVILARVLRDFSGYATRATLTASAQNAYLLALDRLARELAMVEGISDAAAAAQLQGLSQAVAA